MLPNICAVDLRNTSFFFRSAAATVVGRCVYHRPAEASRHLAGGSKTTRSRRRPGCHGGTIGTDGRCRPLGHRSVNARYSIRHPNTARAVASHRAHTALRLSPSFTPFAVDKSPRLSSNADVILPAGFKNSMIALGWSHEITGETPQERFEALATAE